MTIRALYWRRVLAALWAVLLVTSTSAVAHAQADSSTPDDTTAPSSDDEAPTVTPSPTSTSTPTPSPTSTPTPSPTATLTPTPTATPSPTPTPVPVRASITTANDFNSAAATIDPGLLSTLQQILLSSAAEQTNALESHDLSTLAATSTSDYLAWISKTMQTTTGLGVTTARLDALRWSAIAITSPTTASISDRENWTIRYSNGKTAAQESRWIYLLVQGSDDGVWKIQSATPVLEEDG